jgi:Kelch motif
LFQSGNPAKKSESSDPTILNYHLYNATGQTIFQPGPDAYYELEGIGVDNYVTGGAYVSAPSEQLGFYFGGLRNGSGEPLRGGGSDGYNTTNTMLRVDMSSSGHAKWTVEEVPEGRASGQMVWIPVSSNGVLIPIGGLPMPPKYWASSLSDEQTAVNTAKGLEYMTTIPVYDVGTQTWYSQTTEGTGPSELTSFCAVVANQIGGDSFEIFIYGGENGTSHTFDTVWVLSVPSFTWTKVDDGDSAHARSQHFCSTPFPNQMLVFGGYNQGNPDYTLCIADGTLLDIFDLNDLSWKKSYDPSSKETKYQMNPRIQKASRKPDPAIQSLFDQQYQSNLRIWYPYTQDKGKSGSVQLGAIIASACGGAALIAIALLVWYCRPSRRQRRRERRQSNAGTESTRPVSGWLRDITRPSTGIPPVPKDMASDTTTEVDPHQSPMPAEAYGDYRFPQVSPMYHTPAEESSLTNSPRRMSYISAHPPRSPRSPAAGSLEADGEEVHEKDGNGRTSPYADLGQAPLDFRQHPQYPYSIDKVASSDANSLSQSRQGQLGSNVSHLSARSPPHTNTAPSPVVGALYLHEVDNGAVNANEKGTDTIIPPLRPNHQRNASSLSSGLPVTPPANEHDGSRPPLENRMSATSGPISPMYQHEDVRPTHHRHGSSLDSDLSGNKNIALPPPVHPTSPSSIYSPASQGESIYTTMSPPSTARNPATRSLAAADPLPQYTAPQHAISEQENSYSTSTSAEATLIGNALSPMSEKTHPLLGAAPTQHLMHAMAAELRSEKSPVDERPILNPLFAGPRATRRKPVGSGVRDEGRSSNQGEKSAYEEMREKRI